ncbi:hypothetical protein D3C86_1340900 [compost metagenome]
MLRIGSQLLSCCSSLERIRHHHALVRSILHGNIFQDLQFQDLIHQVDVGHNRIGILTAQIDVFQIRSAADQFRSCIAHHLGLNKIKDIGKISRWTIHRRAVGTGTKVHVTE